MAASVKRILNTLPTSERTCNPYDPIEVMNNAEGSLTGYDCPKCKNKGVIYYLQDGYEVFRDCECMEARRSLRRIEQSGLKDALKKCTFESFTAENDFQKEMKIKAANFIKHCKESWFFIGGQVGCGKTHICTAIVRKLLVGEGRNTRYLQWRDEIPKIKAKANSDEYDKLIEPWKIVGRIAVKKAINAPYEAFNEVYKECVTVPFKKADTELKAKIDSVEDGLKASKRENVLKFAEELKASYALDWLNINRVMPNITLSASESSLMQKVSDELDRINDDVQAITDIEVLAEYKKSLNLAQAQTIVNNRRREIEEARLEAERKAQQEEVKQETVKKVETLAPPVVEEKPPKEEVKLYRMTFTVSGTKEQLKALKAFIIDNNIQIIGG